LLAPEHQLICASHPGFGRSSLPDWIDSVEDIAIIHLELMDKLGLARTAVIGCSIGGWIAAEMMTMAPERFQRAVLVGPMGVKIGPADRLDIPDIYAMPPADVQKLLFHDPVRMTRDPSKLSDEDLGVMVRNRETQALIAWEPYMHNPKLRHRLQRIACPTLLVRGESDGLIRQEYLHGYARLIPGSSIQTIAEAGHLPHLEQPEAFASCALSFLKG
jgi:pimeloyl-ACP methyl ester carboxylesterase